MHSIVTIHKIDDNFNEEWFFSTDHCQPNLGEQYVPVTRYNRTKEEIRDMMNSYPVIGCTSKEIPNPNPLYELKDYDNTKDDYGFNVEN